MLLIIPAIEIKGGKCVQTVRGHEGFVYSDDPIEMAKLWRKENAKSLHVTDIDGAHEGRMVNFDIIERMVKTVDIPIELGGGLRTPEEVKRALDAGIFRVLVSTMVIDTPEEAKRTVGTYGASKVVLGIDAQNGIVMTRGWTETTGLRAVSVAMDAKAFGFKRVVYTDITLDGTMRGANLSAIRDLAQRTGMRVTASGGLSGLSDLLQLQEFEPYGVDSVVIGRALYANKLACQKLWRICEAGDFPYTARV